MDEGLLELMDDARGRADYADARRVHVRSERIGVRDGQLERLDVVEDEGVGVRVRLDGAWGFAATRGDGDDRARGALARALEVARSQQSTDGLPLAPEPPARGSYRSPFEIDPFDVPLEDKLAVLVAATAAMGAEPGVTVARAHLSAFRTETTFASSEGALCHQSLTECGGGITALAVGDRESQVRSYPASHGGNLAQAGYEHLRTLDLPGAAPRVGEEAAALLRAPACPEAETALILVGEQLGLQLHESIGHAVELDRVLGREASYAGTSYVHADALGALRVGSPLLDVTADATTRGGVGSFRWDDEGVEGQAVPLVREGILRGFLSSRETAGEIGVPRSGGCMRAEGFARQPLVRMTNVSLEPGDAGTLEELIADTEEGILIDTNRSWSIDSRRLQFRFEGEAAWEIRGGRRGRLLRNPSYTGVTPEFWGGLDAVCSPSEWRLDSVMNCGKGEPGQVMRVSHGSAPARFRGVRVGGG